MRPRTNKELDILLHNGKPTLFQRVWCHFAYNSKNFWYCAFCGKFHSKRIAAHNIYGDPLRGREFGGGPFNICSKGVQFAMMMERRIIKEPT